MVLSTIEKPEHTTNEPKSIGWDTIEKFAQFNFVILENRRKLENRINQATPNVKNKFI